MFVLFHLKLSVPNVYFWSNVGFKLEVTELPTNSFPAEIIPVALLLIKGKVPS